MGPKSLGVALTKCYFCGKGDKIVMNAVLTPERAAKVEKLNGMITDMDPCNECRGYMKKGIIIIGIDSKKSEPNWHLPREGEMPNPYRSGSFIVLREEAVRRMFNGEGGARDFALKHRWVFVEEEVCEMLRQGGRECGDLPANGEKEVSESEQG